MLSIHDTAGLEAYARRHRIDRHHLKQLRNAFYKRQATEAEALQELPEEQRLEFSRHVAFHFLQLHGRHDSGVDGASKLIFQTAQGFLIEAVILRIATGRTALCVSSQVGCAARCSFCATGTMGMAHNLSAERNPGPGPSGQSTVAGREAEDSQRRLHGHGRTASTTRKPSTRPSRCCRSPYGLDLSAKHLLVSTVGIPEAMVRCASRFPQVGMALSLHSARQKIREQMIPLARRYRLAELRDARGGGDHHPAATRDDGIPLAQGLQRYPGGCAGPGRISCRALPRIST